MKKIIYLAFILVALVSCEKVDEMDLLNTVWKTEGETIIIGEGNEVTSTKMLKFLTKDSGEIVKHYIYYYYSDRFSYTVDGNNLYIEVERPLASYTGKIKGNTITLKGINGVEVYRKKD